MTYKPKADSPYRQNTQIVEHHSKGQPGERPDADQPRADTLAPQRETSSKRTTVKEANPEGLPEFSKVEKTKTEKSTPVAKLQPITDPSKEQQVKREATQPQKTVEAERQHLANRAREVLKTRGRISFMNQERLAIREALGRASYDWSETKLAEAFLKELGK